MKGDIEEGARLVNLLSDLIHEEFPDALIIRGASIQFIVLTGVDDVTKRLQYIHNEAKEVRPEYNIIVKAGVYVAKMNTFFPSRHAIMQKRPVPILNRMFIQSIKYTMMNLIRALPYEITSFPILTWR